MKEKGTLVRLEARVQELNDQLQEYAEILFELKARVDLLTKITLSLWIPLVIMIITTLLK